METAMSADSVSAPCAIAADIPTDRALVLQETSRNSERVGLVRLGIGDEAAVEALGRTRRFREQGC